MFLNGRCFSPICILKENQIPRGCRAPCCYFKHLDRAVAGSGSGPLGAGATGSCRAGGRGRGPAAVSARSWDRQGAPAVGVSNEGKQAGRVEGSWRTRSSRAPLAFELYCCVCPFPPFPWQLPCRAPPFPRRRGPPGRPEGAEGARAGTGGCDPPLDSGDGSVPSLWR